MHRQADVLLVVSGDEAYITGKGKQRYHDLPEHIEELASPHQYAVITRIDERNRGAHGVTTIRVCPANCPTRTSYWDARGWAEGVEDVCLEAPTTADHLLKGWEIIGSTCSLNELTLVRDMSGNVRSICSAELEHYCGTPGCTEHLVDLGKAQKIPFNKLRTSDWRC